MNRPANNHQHVGHRPIFRLKTRTKQFKVQCTCCCTTDYVTHTHTHTHATNIHTALRNKRRGRRVLQIYQRRSILTCYHFDIFFLFCVILTFLFASFHSAHSISRDVYRGTLMALLTSYESVFKTPRGILHGCSSKI